jgi:hypothetical protein
MVTEWWKFLRPVYRVMPTWISAGKKEMFELLDIEKDLWMSQLVKAKENINRGNKKPCKCKHILFIKAREPWT